MYLGLHALLPLYLYLSFSLRPTTDPTTASTVRPSGVVVDVVVRNGLEAIAVQDSSKNRRNKYASISFIANPLVGTGKLVPTSSATAGFSMPIGHKKRDSALRSSCVLRRNSVAAAKTAIGHCDKATALPNIVERGNALGNAV